MIPLTRPPATLNLVADERLVRSGAWRKWDSSATAATEFREAFRAWALVNQEGRCAFCRLVIGSEFRRTNTVDHFAPKSTHKYWIYEALNLLAVCQSCNSEIKGETDPVVGIPTAPFDYESASFEVLHPYLHEDFSTHLQGGFDDSGGPPRALEGRSSLGIRTVEVLRLDDDGLVAQWLQEWKAAEWDKEKALLPAPIQADFDRALAELSSLT